MGNPLKGPASILEGIGGIAHRGAQMVAGGMFFRTGIPGLSAADDIVKNGLGKTMGQKIKNSARLVGSQTTATAGIHAGIAVADNFIKETGEAGLLNKYRLSGLGKTAMVGAMGYSAINEVSKQNELKRMGTVSPQIRMPDQMSYDYADMASQDTGASGDLVFALNKLR